MTPEEQKQVKSILDRDIEKFSRYGELCIIEGYNAAVDKFRAIGQLFTLHNGEYVEVTLLKIEDEDAPHDDDRPN